MDQEQIQQEYDASDIERVVAETDRVLTDATAWTEWLADREQKALNVYAIKPEQLVADQRREQGISRDYKGREILELLQNAADAAKKSGQRGSVRIELNPSGLIVANSGIGFTTGGVRSLQTADLSPKRGKNSQLIGSKGLGFRSILNWSRHPLILSGALQLGFSSRYAQELVIQLKLKYKVVQEELAQQQVAGEDPVPLLPLPLDISMDMHHAYVENQTILKRCHALKTEGYNTVIGMPFDLPHSFNNALTQLNLLRPDFLLFSDAIEELSIYVLSERKEDSWEKLWRSQIVNETLIDIRERGTCNGVETCQRWKLFSKTGMIPTSLLREPNDPEKYELVVALLEDGLADPVNLYSFFPTSIHLPLRALCHASLELEQNRKHLQECESNDFVLQQLALFLAELFENQVTTTGDSYRALDLLAPMLHLSNYPSDIQVLQQSLVSALKSRKILPALSQENLPADEALSFPGGISMLDRLPKSIFPNILIARNDADRIMFDQLGVDTLRGEQFVALLQLASDITMQQRASLVLGIINNRLGRDFCYQGLILDTQGVETSAGDSIYLPSSSFRKDLVFPKWANVKILNNGLWELLRGNKVRDSAKALSVFNVHEYSMGNLIAGLVSSANAAVEMLDVHQVRLELLGLLFTLFSLYKNDEDRPDFPKRLTVYLLNQVGEWESASQLYFGSADSSSGKIIERIYKSVPEKLTADSSAFESTGITFELSQSFFTWLGVAEWPRTITSTRVDTGFLDFVEKQLQYPAVFVGNTTHIFKSPDELPDNCQLISYLSLDGIDAILSSESDAILSWLANDQRSISWLRMSKRNGSIGFYPPRALNLRIYQGELPSYIHWKIKYSPWLRSSNGEKVVPVECMVNDSAVSGVFPRPVLPPKERMVELGLTSNLLRHACLSAGVREGIEDLKSEEIYALLAELPGKDPTGNLAKKLYNWLLKTVDFGLDNTGVSYMHFVEHGNIYAKKGDEYRYFPVSETYHVDIEGFPQELLRSLPVATLLKKRGAEKVRRLFGVNVLDKEAVNEKIVYYRAAACTEQANQHFQQAKKYIEVYRHSQFSKASGRADFERLNLLVCENVQSQITFEGVTIENSLPPWTYSIQDDQLYVCCNPYSVGDPYNPLIANTIGDAIASVFGLNDGDSFSKIYQCDENSRAELLSKMLGDELYEDVDGLLQTLIEEASEHAMPEPSVTIGPVPVAPTVSDDASVISTLSARSNPVGAGLPQNDNSWNIPTAVGAEPVEHVPEVPGTRVDIRIAGGRGSGSDAGGSLSGTSLLKSDGRAGEELARLFEESQGRFPLEWWHITGSKTIVADLLSFRTVEDRRLFESGEDQSPALIERVIEAKEKKGGGAVKLTGNEVTTAAQWKSKYFIYRFTPINTAAMEYQLKMLSNPLAQLDAVASSIEISLDIAATSQQFRLFDRKK